MTAASEIMRLASAQLQDVEAVRWTRPELLDWLNEGLKAIVLAKPSAKSGARTLALATGTLQRVEAAADLPTPLAIIDFTRNLLDEDDPPTGGRALRVVNRALLDGSDPNWHAAKPRKEVRQIVFDDENPLQFYTYPPNTGTGVVEVIVSEIPTPVVASGDDTTSLDAYAQDVGLAPVYDPPLLDFILYRAQLKDDVGANAGRAMTHYQAFATALGIRLQVERASSPNRQRTGQQ